MNHDNDNHPLTYLSVCSGIEAASVAWPTWKAVAYSEIEKFPSAVLAHHYPDVPNLGDFTKIDVRTLGRVDILAGGTPCQAFSVAGLRAGLNDARGNLTLKFVELAHELADGNGLRNAVWENVVGVLSDKGNAFGCFLAGLVGADDAIEPPARGKWPRHGMVSGPKGRAAWAVKDAQFFGVAQRRRRVLVVADFGNGADPAAVLFEPEGVFRNSPPSREAGKDVAPSAGISTATSGGRGWWNESDVGATIRAQDSVTKADTLVAFSPPTSPTLLAKGNDSFDETLQADVTHVPEIARCVATREGSSQDYETTTMVAMASIHADSISRTGEAITPSADAEGVVRLRNPGMGVIDDGTTYNLMASGASHAVCVTGDISHSLQAEGCDASEDGTGRGTPVIAFDCKASGMSGFGIGDIAGTQRAMGHKDSHTNGGGHQAAAIGSAVRRLTPMECERLQGFPDGYTRIPLRSYKTKKVTRTRPEDMWEYIDGQWWLMSADGPRYKALGNSWAVPKFRWLGERIERLMPAARPDSDMKEAA